MFFDSKKAGNDWTCFKETKGNQSNKSNQSPDAFVSVIHIIAH